MTTEKPPSLRSPAALGERNGARTQERSRRAQGPQRRSPVRRLVGVTVLIVVATTTAAVLGNMARAPEYGAESDILYRLEDPSGGRAERELATQQVILQGREVLQPVAVEAGLTVEDLQEKLSVEVVGASDVLRLRVGHRDPATAVELTEDIAANYVRTWLDDAVAASSETARTVQDRIDELTTSLTAVQGRLEQAVQDADEGGSPSEQRRLQTEAEGLQRRLASYQDQLANLELESRTQTAEVRILTPAYLLEDPISPGPVQAGAAGLMVGLLVAGALVAVRLQQQDDHP